MERGTVNVKFLAQERDVWSIGPPTHPPTDYFIDYFHVLSQTLTFGTNTIQSVEVVVKRIQIAVTIKDASNWLS